eukprot:Nitzschia sp. Nitz4//scaffold80_size88189//35047//40827//NITZ4_005086-RA/size88189-processed-gene-0.72-mRNA-1//-1//CDS//3329558627//90//frame0
MDSSGPPKAGEKTTADKPSSFATPTPRGLLPATTSTVATTTTAKSTTPLPASTAPSLPQTTPAPASTMPLQSASTTETTTAGKPPVPVIVPVPKAVPKTAPQTTPLQTSTNPSTSTSTSTSTNTGNDRVSVDPPKAPLVPLPSQSQSQSQPQPQTHAHKMQPKIVHKPLPPVQRPPPVLPPKQPAKLPVRPEVPPSHPPPPPPILDEQSILEEQIKRKRAPLTDLYGPYIIPSDTSLQDARLRLHTAIEQTRQLRRAFTDRVYGKYRVCLQPPESTQNILNRILSDPGKSSAELQEELTFLKEEKEIEKKEALKLNAELLAVQAVIQSASGAQDKDKPADTSSAAPATQPKADASEPAKPAAPSTAASTATNTPSQPPSTTEPVSSSAAAAEFTSPLAAMNAENAEQLMYISVGLSLIILPEQSVEGIDMSLYKDRSPTQPNGQRVRSISAAAAAAGEVMLERARKGLVMRDERNRRKQLAASMAEDGSGTEQADVQNYSRLSVLAASKKTPIPVPVPTVSASAKPSSVPPPDAQKTPTPSTATPANKASHPTTPKQTTSKKAGTSSSAPHTSSGSKRPATKPSPATTIPNAKAFKAKVQATMSLQTLLSLNPTAEDLRMDGKSSAATMALMERGVGTHAQNTKAHQQQRLRHPHPESLGGRRRMLQGSTSTHAASTTTPAAHVDKLLDPAYAQLDLPPLPTTKERRTRKPLTSLVTDPEKQGSLRSKRAITKVLNQFAVDPDSEDGRHKKRRVTDIGLMFGLQCSSEPDTDSVLDRTSMDPMLAFHVLGALGLTNRCHSESDGVVPDEHEKTFPVNLNSDLFEIAEKRSMGDDTGVGRRSIRKLKQLHSKFVTERRTLSGKFVDGNLFLKAPKDDTGDASDAMNLDSASEEANAPKKHPPAATNSAVACDSKTASNPPAMQIRGGGEAVSDDNETRKNSDGIQAPVNTHRDGSSTNGATKVQQSGSGEQSSSRNAVPNQPSPARPAAANQSPGSWSEATRQNIMMMSSSSMPGASSMMHQPTGPRSRASGQMASMDQMHPNAIQLANQLRLSRVPPQMPRGGNELAEYISGLHPQSAAAYGWSSIGAASAASVASAQSLAALGLSPHRSGMVNFPLPDRTQALLRDQHNVAAAQAAAARRQHQQALAFLSGGRGFPPPNFPPMGGATMNPSQAYRGQQAPVQSRPPARSSTPKQGPKAEPAGSVGTQQGDVKKSDPKESTHTKVPKVEKPQSSVDTRPAESLEKNPSVDTNKRKPEKEATSQPAEKKARTETSKSAGNEESEEQSPCSPVIQSDSKKPTSEEPASHMPPTEKSENQVPKSDVKNADDTSNSSHPKSAVETSAPPPQGLLFFVPPAPEALSADAATHVLHARGHEALQMAEASDASVDCSVVLDYMLAVGSAVPIPKALVANTLKEKLNAPQTKGHSVGNFPQSAKDIIVACINLTLWRHHDGCFQKAFAKSGRIDVDPDCKWLISAAVDHAVHALSDALDSANFKSGSPLAAALAASKLKNPSQKGPHEKEDKASKLDILVGSIASKALLSGFKLDPSMDSILYSFNDLLDYLDETRKCALQSKSQERALLAALISRRATMSLPFSHAYVSSVVRAGEALGHGEFFEMVQNEEVSVSTMIPYDVFTDETGAWEDPCRPSTGFTAGLTGDDLMRRAHARAMIQKSLKKLQDRHNIKGGTSKPGAYVDPPNTGSASSDAGKSGSNSGGSTPKGWLKRRNSFSEPPIQHGTGSAPATTWALYEPKHVSAPLSWNSEHVENSPYGRHNSATRPRSLSISQFHLQLKARSKQGDNASLSKPPDSPDDEGSKKRSTREVPWVDVAGIFQSVNLPGSSSKTATETLAPSREKIIVAPFVKEVKLDDLDSRTDYESDTEEDLSDAAVLGRHQIVLDRMKEHLNIVLEARKKSQEKRKSRSSKT